VPSIELMDESANEATARSTVGKLATLAAASALAVTGPPAIVDAFMRTRLIAPHAALYGADGIDSETADVLLQRALPEG
jgi:hypothetical protein